MLKSFIVFDRTVRFHARPAARITEAAQKFESMIILSSENRIADAKKVFSVMQFATDNDRKMELVADGPDEAEALKTMKNLLNTIDWRKENEFI